MRRYLIFTILLIFAVFAAACSSADEDGEIVEPVASTAEEFAAQSMEEITTTSTPPIQASAEVEPSPKTDVPSKTETFPLTQTALTFEPDIPFIVDELDFGLPAGNGYYPWQVAVDSQRRRVYTFNQGLASLKEGNTISLFDLEKGQFTRLIKLDNASPAQSLPPTPLALQVDPYRPRLYAIWGDRYGEVGDTTLTIIDLDTLAMVDSLPGVEAVAPAPDRLYLVNDTRLWAVDPDSLTELGSQKLDAGQYNELLFFSAQTKRLYLGRGRPWRVAVFAADSLKPVGEHVLVDELKQMVFSDLTESLLLVEKVNGELLLRALDADGKPRLRPVPVTLPLSPYGGVSLGLAGQTIYLGGSSSEQGYQVHIFEAPDLTLSHSIDLPCYPNDLGVSAANNLIYAICSSPDHVLLTIDPATDVGQTHNTVQTVIDALVDPPSDRLYVLDNRGVLQILSLADYTEIEQAQTAFNPLRRSSRGAGELSLDSTRNRLYIGGDPVHIIDTQTLEVTARLDTPGHLTPDPTTNRLYLTPPCSCRVEQCNTLILNAETLTGTQTIFPPEDPFVAPCVTKTWLDPENQLLYAHISNGIPGSNAGFFYNIFDVSDQPQQLFTAGDINYGNVALDTLHGRAFAPRYRINRGFIHRFDWVDQTITETIELVGAEGNLAYDPIYDRLYVAQQVDHNLQVFDGDLALLAEMSLPAEFVILTLDPQNQRLYLGGAGGRVLVVATGGGDLEPPPPAVLSTDEPTIQRLVSAPTGALFRIYDHRLYRSNDQGQTWALLGRGLPARPVGVVAISPNYELDQTLFAGLWSFGWAGGLYRSTDGGDTWQPTTRGLTDLEIGQIDFSPTYTRDQTIFLTTFDRGLFRSDDKGNSWTWLARNYADTASDMSVDQLAVSSTFADDGLLFISKRNLLRSTDGGETWADLGIGGGRIAFSPNFAADGLILNGGSWRSVDGGQSWQPAAAGQAVTALGAQDILFSPNFATDQTVYMTRRPDYYSPLILQRSVNGGRSWQLLLTELPANFELNAVTLLPDGNLYLSALDGRTQQTPPEALVWGRPPVDITALDLHDLAITPNGTLFLINGGAGVFKSTDQGRTWLETDFPARSSVFDSARIEGANDGALFAAMGTALERSVDGGASWTYLDGLPSGFEISALAVSPNFAADGIVLVGGSYVSHDLLRSVDGGETWQLVFEGDTLAGSSDVSNLVFSPNFAADNTVYAWIQYGGLLRSTDGGLNWSPVVLDGKEHYFAQSLAVSPGGDEVIIGALDGHILVWQEDRSTVSDVGANLPDRRVWSTALAFGPNGSLLVGTDVGVYRTVDGGQTWTRQSAGLPLRPDEGTPQAVRVLAFEDGRLYAALTRGGLFISTDGGQTWRSAITGEPASPLPIPPTPTPTSPDSSEACPLSPTHFVDLWADRVAQLGCPVTDGGQEGLLMVEQPFEGGRMFWRSDNAAIYALPTNQPFIAAADTWDSAQPPYSCPDLAPSQTPPTPQRGFGKVWCAETQMREFLGDATGVERPFEAVLQEFETGLIFMTNEGTKYVLEIQSNNWERLE